MNRIQSVLIVFVCLVVLSETYLRDGNSTYLRRAKKLSATKKFKKDVRRLKKHDGAIKLVGGERGSFEGNVEILHWGRWGNVCDDEWDDAEAEVVCRQLGYGGEYARATKFSHFGHARRRFWMDEVYCDGSESRLDKCRFAGWGKTHCEGSEAAGVICGRVHDEDLTLGQALNHVGGGGWKIKIKDVHQRGIGIRLVGGRTPVEGRVEVKLGHNHWGVVCGDGWSLLEASVICRQLGLGYAAHAIQTNYYGGRKMRMAISGIKCFGDETNLAECLHDDVVDCPGEGENVAGIVCSQDMADLVFDYIELERTAHIEDRQLYWLQCAMEENCLASRAYQIQRESNNWHMKTRRLLRFTARILNAGTADFRPAVPKHLWEWHMCHMHYHSMEVFATFDVIDSNGNKVAEGHKASFCLEDNQCLPGIRPRYRCANYGDQGISVNCSDIYKYNIDCQWVDVSELTPGEYVFKVAVNPEFKVGEMTFNNNAAVCKLHYSKTFARVHSCVMGRP